MNPDQPSREQIEARITALLCGELPADEAELLRWTISQDPELQKLQDQLKGAIGLMREALKNPAGAQVEKDTPLKLSDEKRQRLLAHFKTERPKPLVPPLRARKFPLIEVLAVAALVAVLAAVLLPVRNASRSRGMASMEDMASHSTLGVRRDQPMVQEQAWSMERKAYEERRAENASHQAPPTGASGQAPHNPPAATTTPPQMAQIVLPNTENQNASEQSEQNGNSVYLQNKPGFGGAASVANFNPGVSAISPTPPVQPQLSRNQIVRNGDTNVYSQNVVGYVNISLPTNAPVVEAPTPPSASAPPALATEVASALDKPIQTPVAAPPPNAESALPPNDVNGLQPPPALIPREQQNANVELNANSSPVRAGGTYGFNTVNDSVPAAQVSDNPGNIAKTKAPKSETQPSFSALVSPRLRGQYGQGNAERTTRRIPVTPLPGEAGPNVAELGAATAAPMPSQPAATFAPSPPQAVTESSVSGAIVPVASASAPPVSPVANGIYLPDNSASGYGTNGVAGSSPLRSPDSSFIARNSYLPANFATNSQSLHYRLDDNFEQGGESGDTVSFGSRENQNANRDNGVAGNAPVLGELFKSQSQKQSEVVAQSGTAGTLTLALPPGAAPIPARQQSVQTYGIVDTDLNSIQPTPTITSRQLQAFESELIGDEAAYSKMANRLREFQTIQATNPTALADVLAADNGDSELSEQISKLNDNERKWATETNNLGLDSTERAARLTEIGELKKKINDRVAGMMTGLKVAVQAQMDRVNTINNKLAELKTQMQEETDPDQPYWDAKRQLVDRRELHQLLAAKIDNLKAEAAIPTSTLVTVVNSAVPGTSQNLWQRMTGEVESDARIKLQPDYVQDVNPNNSGVSTYGPYDPYFLETEEKSIKSDAVLGRVVDDLKLDQAWGDQSNGEKLSRKDAIALLRSRLDLEGDRNTMVIAIGAKSDKPDEAAKIANAVAEAYKQYRMDQHLQREASGIAILKRQYAEDETEIAMMQSNVDKLRMQYGLTPPPAVTPHVPRPHSHPMIPASEPPPVPQPEIQTSDNAFSTFSLNVSDVSFTLAEASLEKGLMPKPSSIRTEEFINAFDYHDPEPLQGEPLAFRYERAANPFEQERDFLRFSVKVGAVGRQAGRALNIVLLLDTSGSMERADRVAIIREALRVLAGQLEAQDTVSVVTFARTARLWADGIPGDQAGATLDKVGSITPEGGTNLEEAMRLAYETALRHFVAGGMNRVVLLTDGAANLGNVDPQALTQKVETERRQGIALDCFGIGWEDYNDDLLEQLSSNGDGRYAFINSPDEASTEFAAKLAGALQVAAEDVKVQVEFNPSRVTAWRQIGYAKHQLTKEQFRDNTVAAGTIAAREAGNALYVIETDPNGQGPIATVRVRYRVPGTQDNYEKSWSVDYTGAAPELAQSSPAMRLEVSAAEFAESLAQSPFAQEVTPDQLLNYLSGVPQFFNADERPKQLESMILQAKSVGEK